MGVLRDPLFSAIQEDSRAQALNKMWPGAANRSFPRVFLQMKVCSARSVASSFASSISSGGFCPRVSAGDLTTAAAASGACPPISPADPQYQPIHGCD
ncbi:hypothetical protein ACLOJK_021420 [Asimina triloba]